MTGFVQMGHNWHLNVVYKKDDNDIVDKEEENNSEVNKEWHAHRDVS